MRTAGAAGTIVRHNLRCHSLAGVGHLFSPHSSLTSDPPGISRQRRTACGQAQFALQALVVGTDLDTSYLGPRGEAVTLIREATVVVVVVGGGRGVDSVSGNMN